MAIGALLASWFAACSAQRPEQAGPSGEEQRPTPAAVDRTAASSSAPTCPSWEHLDPAALPPLPSSPYTPVFEQVWHTVLTRHYDVTLACLNWPLLREQYGQEVAAAASREGAYRAINAMLDRLGQSHLQAMAPPSGRAHRTHMGGPAQIAAPVVWLGDRLVVRPTRPGEPKSKLPAGTVIEAVDGATLRELVDFSTASTPIARASALVNVWACPDQATRHVTVAPTNKGKARVVSVSCRLPPGDRLSMGHLEGMVGRVHAEMIDSSANVGYLAFSVWMLPLVPTITRELHQLQQAGMKALIIDLRGNHGGVATMPIPVSRLLLRQGGSLGQLVMRGFSQELVVRPNPQAFDGPVVLLLDHESASTSELFALGLRELGRVSVVAAGPSAGMALPSLIEGLPDGGLLQHVVGNFRSKSGGGAEGAGLLPDQRISESPEIYASRGDVVLAAALALARDKAMAHESP